MPASRGVIDEESGHSADRGNKERMPLRLFERRRKEGNQVHFIERGGEVNCQNMDSEAGIPPTVVGENRNHYLGTGEKSERGSSDQARKKKSPRGRAWKKRGPAIFSNPEDPNIREKRITQPAADHEG